MTDYISREEVLHALCEAVHSNDEYVPCRNQIVSCQWKGTRIQEYAKMILAIPAADMRPVVRGEWKTAWLDHEDFGERPRVLYCSACNQVASIRTPFCPHCGADMRGKEDGHDGRM